MHMRIPSSSLQWQSYLAGYHLHMPCRQSSKHFHFRELKVIPFFRYSVFSSIPQRWAWLEVQVYQLVVAECMRYAQLQTQRMSQGAQHKLTQQEVISDPGADPEK